MDSKHYICNYCYGEFIPTRRHVQKFCSNSCRSKSHHIKKRNTTSKLIKQAPKVETNKIDKMSAAGIGNAAVGLLAGHAVKSMFTAPDNQPATKGDIKILLERMDRYHKVENLPLAVNGSLPYFDMETKKIVYFKNSLLAKMGK